MHKHALKLCSALHTFVLGTTLCALSSSLANAGPQDGVVSAGTADITTNGNSTLILQGTDRAAIDWRTFDVKPNESVVFKQPSASSITLNRIHDQKPSQIFGSVIANGQLILSNPSGMIFGKDSRVDVAGLVATTASIGTSAFMNDAMLNFGDAGKSDAKIINEGTITAKAAGLIALVAPQVENKGFIGARLGKIELAGADTFTVDFYGDGLINLAVDSDTLKTAVTNSGTLRAKAGTIALTAAQAEHLLSSTVNIGGLVDANASRVDANGTVVFGEGFGGNIQASACTVNVESGAELDARGPNGGGIVKIGGDWQGKQLLHGNQILENAQTVAVQKGAVIRATAMDKGDGGTVVLWSEDATRFDGTIRARGGKNGGNGGRIETSSKGALGVIGDADASALFGLAGEWLLDPRNVTISGGGAYSVNPAGETVDPGSDNFTILASSISTALTNGNNVSITTGTTGGQTGDITLDNATIAKTGGGPATLTFKAEGSITTNGANSITSNTGALNVIFWSDAEAVPNSDGYIHITNTTITTNGGDIILGGGLDDGANGGAAADGRPDNYAWGNIGLDDGVTLNNTDINAAGGSFKFLGHGRNNAGSSDQAGIKINNGSLLQTSGTGSFTMIGVAGSGTDDNRGIHIADSGTELDVDTGAITLTGTGAGSGQNNFGIEFHNGAEINSTGAGAGVGTISFDGTASAVATGQMNIGTMIRNPNTLITAVDGDISITGRGNNSAGIKGSGIWVHDSAHVETTGTGANAGDIALTGFGLNGDEQHGVLFQAHGRVYTAKGNINVTGSAVGSGSAAGILMVNGGEVDSLAGNISLTGTKVGGNSDIVLLPYTDTNLIGSNTMTGNITFNADSLDFQAQDIRTQNNILFVPRTNNTAIGVSGGAGALQISDGVLSSLNPDVDANGTGTLIIGNSAAGAGTVDINGWDISGKTYDVEVYGGLIDFTGGAVTWNRDNSLLFYSRTNDLVLDQDFARNAGVAGNGTLTLKASGSITTSGTRTINAASGATSGGLNTILWSDADNSGAGNIILNTTTINSNDGAVILGGGLDNGANGGVNGDGRPDNFTHGIAGDSQTRSGIYLDTVSITSGSSAIVMRGEAIDDAANGSLRGIYGANAVTLTTTSGGITIVGNGGDGTSNNNGVLLGGSTVTTQTGAITITGTGGNGSSFNSMGANIFDTTIQSQGVAGASDVRITGNGGTGTSNNYGIALNNADITVHSADLYLNGQAGGGGSSDYGIYISNTSTLNSLDTGADAGNITIDGTGGNGTTDSFGVRIADATTTIYTVDGDIGITGHGAAGSVSTQAVGIWLSDGADILSDGTGASAGKITLTGNAGGGTGSLVGTYIKDTGTTVTSKEGKITINGTGGSGAAVGNNYGTRISDATITSVTSADIEINGTGGNGGVSNRGVYIFNPSTLITTQGTGNINITGNGGDAVGTSSNHGVYIRDGAEITSTATGANAGNIIINGTSGDSDNNNYGIYISENTTKITTVDGDIVLTGQGGTGSGTWNEGMYFNSSAEISSSGTGVNAGSITINATAGSCTNNQFGLDMESGAFISSRDGNIDLHGTGGSIGGGANNQGIHMNGASITTNGDANIYLTGTSTTAGSIDILQDGAASTIGTAGTTTGVINFTANTISFSDLTARTNKDIYFVPRSPGTSIGISGGTCGGACTLNITDTVLSKMFADNDANGFGTLIIGDDVGGTGLVEIAGWDISGNRYDVEVYGGTVNFDTGAIRWNQDNSLLFYSRTGDLNIDTGFTRNASVAGDGTLTFKAAGNITTSGTRAITAATAGATGKLNTILWSDADNNGSGYISLADLTVTTNGGDFVAAGGLDDGANILAENGITVLYDGVAADGRPDNYATGQNAANNDGVLFDTVDVSTGTGSIIMRGHGFDEVVGATDFKLGMAIFDDSDLLTTSGNIVLDGKGGNGNSFGRGLGIYDATTSIITTSGAISAIGRAATTGVNTLNGLIFFDNATIQSTGSGAGIGAITLQGVAGGGTGNTNMGAIITDAHILSDSANIAITGRGAGAGFQNYGIQYNGASTIVSSGTGANAANITFDGTGGNGTFQNYGIAMFDTASMTTVDGDISITGLGGNGSTDSNQGIASGGGSISSTGTGASAGNITLNGTAGTGGTSDGLGVNLSNLSISTVDGDVGITGQGHGSGLRSYGIGFTSTSVTSTGTGASAGNITITGTAGNTGSGNAHGVYFIPGTLSTVDGDILITGTAGNSTGDDSDGIYLLNGSTITSTGNTASAGTITLTGHGANGVSYNNGIYLRDPGTVITSGYGNIVLSGDEGTVSGIQNSGVVLFDGAKINSTGTGALAANITVNGTAGQGTQDSIGIQITNNNAGINTVDGDILLTGVGKGTANDNYGIDIEASADIISTGTGASAGTITLNGTGGNGAAHNYGILTRGVGTTITSVDGAISLTGQGGLTANSTNNYGIWTAAPITASGAAGISLTGTGGGGTDFADGIYMNTTLSTLDGSINLIGQGGTATGRVQVGTYLEGVLQSTGAGNISVTGTGGNNGTDSSFGIYGNGAATEINVNSGNITLNGIGGTGSSNLNHGIFLDTMLRLQSGGAGTIALTGTRGDTNAATYDIRINGGAQTIGGAGATGAQTWTADTVSLSNFTAQTSGAITFKTRTLGQNINLGGATGGLDLSDANLDALVAGNLIFGQATGTGTLTLDAYAWDDPVRFLTAGTGSINVSGAQTAAAASDATMRFSGPTTLNNTIDLSAAAGARTLAFNNAVTLGANSTLDTGAGNITFDSTLNGAHTLDVSTTGDLTFTGNVGLLTPLGDVTIANVHDLTADILYANNFTVTGGTGNIAFSNNSLHAAADVNISTTGNITGTYHGINGTLHSTAGNVNATVNFDTLDITGLGATLFAGRVGAAGVADQNMANRISIGGVSFPTLIADPAYTFASYIIGAIAAPPPAGGGGSGGGGGILPGVPSTPGTPGGGGGNPGGGNDGGSDGGAGGLADYYALFNDFEAAQRLQVMDVTRGTLLFEAAQFDPTYGSIIVAPAPEIETPSNDTEEKVELPSISTKSGNDSERANNHIHKKPLYKVWPIVSLFRLSSSKAAFAENK